MNALPGPADSQANRGSPEDFAATCLPSVLAAMVERQDRLLAGTDPALVRWGCPVLAFGWPVQATVATVGLNPSNREFMTEHGAELSGQLRRFPTLNSLGIDCWADVNARHLQVILRACRDYFLVNPYRGWFGVLDSLLSGIGVTFFGDSAGACHVDIIPFATANKWSELGRGARENLLSAAGDSLAAVIRASNVNTLVLNGASVVREFERLAGVRLTKEEMPGWTLRRNGYKAVAGIAYRGVIDKFGREPLERDLLVLGYNHNLQSSFGVTASARTAIRQWLAASSVGSEC